MRERALGLIDFRLEDLEKELAESKTSYPRCLVINEIGVIWAEKPEKRAEVILRELLGSDSDKDRALAYCYLSTVAAKTEKETENALQKFEGKEYNGEIIRNAKRQIERIRRELAQKWN